MTKTFYPSHQPRKRFGQHFLVDEGVLAELVYCINPKTEDNCVEIGPGQGALTKAMLPYLTKLTLIELDRDLIPYLEELSSSACQLIIYNEDALQFNLEVVSQVTASIRLVGNLPYNVATPLLFHFLGQKQFIKDMHFMVQKEVAERLVAQPGEASYSRLSVMIQYHCATENLFLVAPQAFMPPPKVDSAVVRLIPYKSPPFAVKEYALFENVVRQAFSHRRKTLRNSLKPLIDEARLTALNIDANLRPEQIKIEEYVKIADALATINDPS